MPTIEESLSAIRSGGAPPVGSIEDSLSQIRAAKTPAPAHTFGSVLDFRKAALGGAVAVGDIFQIGGSVYRAAPRQKRAAMDPSLPTHDIGSEYVGQAPAGGGERSIEDSLAMLRAGEDISPPPAPVVEPQPSPRPATEILGEEVRDLAQSVAAPAARAVRLGADPFWPPEAPTSIAETLQLLRAGQAPIPAGPAAVTEPTALLEKAGKSVKEAVSGALKVEDSPRAGVFSKTLGKLLMAPTEAALGIPPGFLSKIEDAVGEKAISPAGQETLRQAVLSQPFTPSEFQEAIGAEAIFTAGIPLAFQGILKRFPGMAGRLGFQEAGEVVRQAAARGVKIPVSAEDMKAFITGVGDLDPVVADKLKGIAGEMGSEKFNAALKDVLAGKRKFFVEVPRETLPARKALPVPKGSIEDSLREIRSGEGLPGPIEAAKRSGRRGEFNETFLKMLEDKADSGVPFSENDKKVIAVLQKEGYDIPNEGIERIADGVRGPVTAGPGGAGADGPGGAAPGVVPGQALAAAGAGPLAPAPAPVAGAVAVSSPAGGIPAAGVEPVPAPGLVKGQEPGAEGPEAVGAGAAALPGETRPRRGAGKAPVQPGGDAQKPTPAGPVAPSEGKGLPQEGPKRPPVKVVASEEAAAKLIPKKSTLPVLHSFKVEGGKMSVTNLEVFLEKKTDRAAGMYKFVGKDVVPSDAKAEDYVLAPDESVFEPAGTVDRDDLIRNFERVERAASTDATRFVLESVALKVQDGKALLVATDGRRLSMSPLDTAKIKDGTYILRANEGIAEALKALAPGDIEFGIHQSKAGAEQMQFKAPDGRVVARAIEGSFPNFEQILPESETEHTVSRADIEKALKELRPYAKEEAKANSRKFSRASEMVNIEKKPDGLELSAGTEGTRKAVLVSAREAKGPFEKIKAGTVVMPIGPGKDMPQATFGKFDLNFLSDAVGGVQGESVVIGRHSDSTKPFTVSGKSAGPVPPKATRGKGSYEIDAPGGGEPPTKIARAMEDLPPAIEMPELVEMAQKLLDGKMPKIMESLRKEGARGVFRPGTGEISLRADIAKDAAGAANTLAHEIGHAIDWLPDEDMARGNILGRIGSLRKYIKSMIEAMPDQPYKVLTDKERGKIRSQAVNAILKKMGKNISQYIASKELKEAVAAELPEVYKAKMAEEVARRGLLTRDEIMAELKALNQKWKPFDVKADTKYTEYRYSSSELYADTISVLFNDPALARQEAPKFYKAWFAYVDRKPEVKGAYEQIIERIRKGDVQEVRDTFVEGMFEAGERQFAHERLATHKSARDIVEGLRDELIDKNEGVLAWVRKVKKTGKVVRPEDSPQYALEEMNYVSSEVKAYLEDYNAILKDLNEAGVAWRRVGHVLFHERVINERGELFNPRGFTPDTSRRQLEYAEKSMGPEKWEAVQKAVEAFRKAREKVVKMMGESEMFSKDLMEKTETNHFYATFDVFSKHVDEAAGGSGVGASIHRQIGTLQEISNPATATLLKDVALIKAMRRNEATKKTVAFLDEHFGPTAVRPAETKWNGKFHEPMKPKGADQGLLAYMEGGKIKAFVVDKWVARVFEHDPVEANVVVEGARLTQRFFREIFTQKNPGFQLFNLWRDFFRAYKNLPGMSLASLARYYMKSMTPAFRRGMDIPDPLVKEMLEKKMLITVEDKWGLSTEDEQVRALMDRYFGNRTKEDPTLKGKFLDLIRWVGDIGSAVEAMPKVAGYKYLKEHQAELGLSDKVIAHMIRGQVGSPDFMRKGRGYSWYNTIAMFSNAIKEGWRSDIEVMRARPGEYAWKSAKLNFLPKLLMYGGSIGLLGAGMKDMMDGIPEYDKTNYLVIPLGKTPQGRTVYLRVPQDEAGRFVGGLLWKMLGRNADPQNLADYMAGQAPTLNPILGVVEDSVLYASGKNPYDFFRQRNVIGEREFEAGGWRSHRLFLKHIANSLGSGIVHTFKTNDLQKTKTELEEGLGLPIVSNVIGRFIKVSDYGKAEMIRREVEKSRKATAREKLDEQDAMVMHLNAVDQPGTADAAKLYAEMVKDGMLRRGRGTGMVSLAEFLKEYNRFAEKKEGDPYMNAIIFAKTNEERADLLEYYRKTMPKADYEKVLAQAVGGGLMTAKPLMLSFIEEKKK